MTSNLSDLELLAPFHRRFHMPLSPREMIYLYKYFDPSVSDSIKESVETSLHEKFFKYESSEYSKKFNPVLRLLNITKDVLNSTTSTVEDKAWAQSLRLQLQKAQRYRDFSAYINAYSKNIAVKFANLGITNVVWGQKDALNALLNHKLPQSQQRLLDYMKKSRHFPTDLESEKELSSPDYVWLTKALSGLFEIKRDISVDVSLPKPKPANVTLKQTFSPERDAQETRPTDSKVSPEGKPQKSREQARQPKERPFLGRKIITPGTLRTTSLVF